MRKPYIAKLYNSTGQKDAKGNWVELQAYVKDIACDLQPYSQDLLLKNYGYNIECNKRIFCDFDQDIKIGSILKYTDRSGTISSFEVKTIINWDDFFMEIAALQVV